MDRSRRVFLVLGALVGATVAAIGLTTAFGSDDDAPGAPSDGASRTRPESDQLYQPSVWALGETLWVYGGIAGPEGSAPPMSTRSGPGWHPNRTVSEYAPDGELLRQVRVPAEASPIGHSAPHAFDGSTFLLGDDVLIEIRGEAVSTIPVDLPPAERTGTDVLGSPIAIGAHGRWIVGLQDDGQTSYPPTGPGDDRLLRIDSSTGAATEIALPPSVPELRSSVCVRDGDLYVATAALEGEGLLQQASVLRLPIGADDAEWTPVTTIDFDGERVAGGVLHCLEASDEVVVQVNAHPTILTTVDVAPSGDPDPRRHVLDDDDPGGGLDHIGVVDGRDLFWGVGNRFPVLFAHTADGAFERVGADIEEFFPYVAVAGTLYDATGLTRSTDPAEASIEPLDLGP